MTDVVVVEAVRTPLGRRKGALAHVHPVDLSATVLSALVERTGVPPADVDDVMWGVVNQISDQSSNVGRLAALAAGWPTHVPGTTIDRACGSSQQAIHFAVATIAAGLADVVVAGGVESMSRVPIGSARAMGEPYGRRVLDRFGVTGFNQGLAAEEVARRWGLDRQRLDEFSVASHERALAATSRGAFEAQTIRHPDADLATDEGIRPGTSVEGLAKLNPAFREDGVIHAGNSSQISDGAAALLLMTREKAAAYGLTPLVRFVAGTAVGDDPVLMLTAPIPATRKVLARAGLRVEDIGVFEVNEAFAPVPLAWQAEFGVDDAVLNPLGGAIAVGHPLGASGAVLMTRMIHHLVEADLRFGLQTMCEAGGMANATVIEREGADR